MITPAQLARVGAATLLDARLDALRPRFPELHFSECCADDVSPRYRAALTVAGYELYLISGASGHCLELTNDSAIASGILIARKVDDE